MKQLLLKHGQSVLTSEQKEYIINTGWMPDLNDDQLQMTGVWFVEGNYRRKLSDC